MPYEGGEDYYNDLEPNLLDENQNLMIAFYELIYENNKNWFEIESQLRISEYMKIEEGHQTILTEGFISDFFKKIIEVVKNFFRKLKEIIIRIFDNVKNKHKSKNTRSVEDILKDHKDVKFSVCMKLVQIFEKNKEILSSLMDIDDIECFVLVGPKAVVLNKYDPKTKEGERAYREYFSSEIGYQKELFNMARKIGTEVEKVFVGLNKYTSSLKTKQFTDIGYFLDSFNSVFKKYLKDLSEQKTEISIIEAAKIADGSENYIKYLKESYKKIDNFGDLMIKNLKKYEKDLQASNIDENLCRLILSNINYAISTYIKFLNDYTRAIFQAFQIPLNQIQAQFRKFAKGENVI